MFDYSSCSASPTQTLIWTWLEGLVRPYEHLRSFRKASKCLLKAHEETLSRYSPSSFTSPWSSQLSYRSGLSDNPGLSGKPTTLISLGIQQGTLIHEAILMWWPGFLCFPVVPKKKGCVDATPRMRAKQLSGFHVHDHTPCHCYVVLCGPTWTTIVCLGLVSCFTRYQDNPGPLSHSSHFGGF